LLGRYPHGAKSSKIELCHESAAATPKHRFSHGTAFTYRHHEVETHAPLIELKPELTGVIRRGDPLQMLTPFAPAKYGTAEQNTVLNPDVFGREDGIKLLSVRF
jgi:hypothetical protein